MNEVTIPDNNLPVFLRQYDMDIIDNKKESVRKVLYTTVVTIPPIHLSREKIMNILRHNLIYIFL